MKQVKYKDTEIYQVYSEFLKCPKIKNVELFIKVDI